VAGAAVPAIRLDRQPRPVVRPGQLSFHPPVALLFEDPQPILPSTDLACSRFIPAMFALCSPTRFGRSSQIARARMATLSKTIVSKESRVPWGERYYVGSPSILEARNAIRAGSPLETSTTHLSWRSRNSNSHLIRTKPRRTEALLGGSTTRRFDGRSRIRTWDLFLIREAL
jgi:hypothetical protein